MYKLIYLNSLIILIFLGNFDLLRKRENKIITYFFIFIFSLIFGFRILDIPDTKTYYIDFVKLNKNILDIGFSYYESGFVILSKIIKNVIMDPNIYFTILSIINFLLIKIALKIINKKEHIILGLCIYISYYGIYFNMIVLRLGLAISFFFIAMIYLKKNKKVKSLLFYIFSYFFHKSIIFGGLVYLIPKKELKRRYYIIIIIIIGVIYYTKLGEYFLEYFINIYIKYFPLENRYMLYLKNISYNNLGYSYKFLFNYILVILFVIEKKYDSFYLSIVLIGLIIFSFFNKILLIERISDIYIFFNIVNSIIYLEKIKVREKKHLILTSIIICNFVFVTRILRIF